jgi:alpha-ketoglutarate-dependent taurine dioxygenase
MDDPEVLARWQARCATMGNDHFSVRVLDVGGRLMPAHQAAARAILREHGAVHLVHTGLKDADDVAAVLPGLGFDEARRFDLGGRTSRAVQEKWVSPGLRRMDHYPAPLYLLPNNEVQYLRTTPVDVLLAFTAVPDVGGRTFLHSAVAFEAALRDAGPVGEGLLRRLEAHGVTIENGFLDARHPLKPQNTFQSWQERSGTDDADLALQKVRADDEVDAAWWHDEAEVDDDGRPLRTLMTRLVLSAFMVHPRTGERLLRFPRLAMDGPSTRNGHRRFPLGNGEALTPAERALLREVSLQTREGIPLSVGDVILFDNLRYGHSREPYDGVREVLVGMAGAARNDGPQTTTPPTTTTPTPATAKTTIEIGRFAQPAPSPVRYVVPSTRLAATPVGARVFDAGGVLDDARLAGIAEALRRHGAVHVRRTGLAGLDADALPARVLEALGFSSTTAFPWGGMASGRTTREALSRELRATDAYPSDLWLLPHNEVLYQRQIPARLLFFGVDVERVTTGGRTFVHDADDFEACIAGAGDVGARLLASLERHGLLIEMGFIDERHPARGTNFFRSWQDRFATTSKDEALARCRAATHQFDEAWWHDEPIDDGDDGVATLMTRIRVPARAVAADGRARLLFPRVALTGPAVENGHRRYTLGDGTPFSDDEIDVLVSAFVATAEAVPWRNGDLLLVDNVRYGHSREAFVGPRQIGVAMGGVVEVPAMEAR